MTLILGVGVGNPGFVSRGAPVMLPSHAFKHAGLPHRYCLTGLGITFVHGDATVDIQNSKL
jgi:hypothetical protein